MKFSGYCRITLRVTVLSAVTLGISGTLPRYGYFVPVNSSNSSNGLKQSRREALRRVSPAERGQIREVYGKSQAAFQANWGELESRIKFSCRSNHYDVFLSPTEAVFAVRNDRGRPALADRQLENRRDSDKGKPPMILDMQFQRANMSSEFEGCEELPGKSNYFIGADPSKWRTNIPSYRRLVCRNVYRGVDLVYRTTPQDQIEYDLVLAPGADTADIKLGFRGARKIDLDCHGNLIVETSNGQLCQHKPFIYQEVDGLRQEVDGSYVIANENEIGFQVASYDPKRTLIIDPALDYSTFLGGSQGDAAYGIAVDAAGNAYVTGFTQSVDFPIMPGAYQSATSGFFECVFVTKLDPGGNPVYSTYLGGQNDNGISIAVDSSGNAYITGKTYAGFPTTPGAFQTTAMSGPDIFVTKLGPSGSELVYSTYIGRGVAFGIALDSMGNAYVTGNTSATDFPTTPGAFQTSKGAGFYNAFVTKLNPTGTSAVYSTYLGESNTGRGIAVDPSGNAYITGDTYIGPAATPGSLQTVYGGGSSDGFVAKLNETGSALVYSTYLGGQGPDGGRGIAVDAAGNAYVTGYSNSPNFPTTSGAFQTVKARAYSNAFICKLNPKGKALVYSTFLGGALNGGDVGFAIAFDSSGNAYVTGLTSSFDFPTTNAFQTSLAGGDYDGFVTKLSADGSHLLYSSYIGGHRHDSGNSIAINGLGNAYVAGSTLSSTFPTTAGAFQSAFAGIGGEYASDFGYVGGDGFVAKLGGPTITSAAISGKMLLVSGKGFDAGAVLLLDGAEQATRNDAQSPTSLLIAKKAGKKIATGQHVTLQVRDFDGTLSPGFSFTR